MSMYYVMGYNDTGKLVFRSEAVNINAAIGIAKRKEREANIGYYPDGMECEIKAVRTGAGYAGDLGR